MTTLEEKLNLVMEYIVAGDAETRFQLREKIMQALFEDTPPHKDYTLDNLIDDFLTEIGVPCHLVGHAYVTTAFNLIINDPTYLDAITYRLYVDIAAKHDATSSHVERGIRTAVERTWDRIDFSTIGRLFGNIVDRDKGKPTNSEFLAASYKILSRRMRDLK